MSVTTVDLAQLIDKIAPNSTVLDLRGYGLEALPENIGDLTYLTKLNLNGNRLTSLPESIGKLTNLTELYLNGHKLTTLPESIGNLTNLTRLDLNGGSLRSLPESIANLINLTELKLSNNKFDRIPDILFRLPKLQKINLDANPLTDISNLKYFPQLKSIYRSNSRSKYKIARILGNVRIVIGDRYLEAILADLDSFTNITSLGLMGDYGSCCIYADEDVAHLFLQETLNRFFSYLSKSPKLTEFNWDACIYPSLLHPIVNIKNGWSLSSDYIGVYFNCYSGSNYCELGIHGRQLQYLPESLSSLKRLNSIRLDFNPLTDLSILNKLPNLSHVVFGATLPRRYWTKLSEWKPEWLLDENNAEIRRMIIEQVGYEKICEVLKAKEVDTWREYLLLKIDNFEPILERGWKPIGKEPIVLLKMICPSTGHIHMLRVPPDMTSAEEAIFWVNHGIHPDRFTIQT